MSLEAFTGWIKDLVSTNPTGTDGKSQGDDHIRGLKATLKAQFSGLTQGKPITVTEDQINSIPTIAADAESRVAKVGDTMSGALHVHMTPSGPTTVEAPLFVHVQGGEPPAVGFQDDTAGTAGQLRLAGNQFQFRDSSGAGDMSLRSGAHLIGGQAHVIANAGISTAWQDQTVLVEDIGTKACITLLATGAGQVMQLYFEANTLNAGSGDRAGYVPMRASTVGSGDVSENLSTTRWVRTHSKSVVNVQAPTKDWSGIDKIPYGLYHLNIHNKVVSAIYYPGRNIYSSGAIEGNATVFFVVNDAGFSAFAAVTLDSSAQVAVNIDSIAWG